MKAKDPKGCQSVIGLNKTNHFLKNVYDLCCMRLEVI